MPISDCEVRDPRIRRTRQLLQGALRNLMESKSLDEISVQDITDAATVNRATFYDHYTDKFALLEAMIAGGFHHLLAERNVGFDGTCPSAASAIILATCDYLVQSQSGGDCTKQRAFDPLIDAAIVAAIRRTILKGVENQPLQNPALTPEIVATAASWAIYGAAKQWFQTPDRPPATEIVGPILGMVVPILSETARPPVSEPAVHQASELASQ
ncbi:TetR/AcrR family transcriptional regulator [Edaphobacter bradus]|uniref:TetR/AcrR family transcriptional regulator n=1 Tax=Edaphobacter bradus TaxID=2259016 RepID=UPI0021DF9A48|nr:TetR family transcriptional regulator [Edaphobacter bradus]